MKAASARGSSLTSMLFCRRNLVLRLANILGPKHTGPQNGLSPIFLERVHNTQGKQKVVLIPKTYMYICHIYNSDLF